ncbi:MAG TPA: acyltransferase family protein, partial [Burkholderiaceae bacterium]|nr:acyltransferase family protein [Burkholderiaceae bacterium]
RLRDRLPRWLPVIAFALMLTAASVGGDIRGWPRLAFQLAGTAFIASVVLQPADPLVRLLEWRPLAYVGAISYGIYLLHMIVLDLVNRSMARLDLHAESLTFVACLVGTIALSAVSFRFFEQPLLRIKNRFH